MTVAVRGTSALPPGADEARGKLRNPLPEPKPIYESPLLDVARKAWSIPPVATVLGAAGGAVLGALLTQWKDLGRWRSLAIAGTAVLGAGAGIGISTIYQGAKQEYFVRLIAEPDYSDAANDPARAQQIRKEHMAREGAQLVRALARLKDEGYLERYELRLAHNGYFLEIRRGNVSAVSNRLDQVPGLESIERERD